MLALDVNGSIELWLEKLHQAGWFTLYEPTPGEEVQGGYTLALFSPW
jgi:hypothetical protein